MYCHWAVWVGRWLVFAGDTGYGTKTKIAVWLEARGETSMEQLARRKQLVWVKLVGGKWFYSDDVRTGSSWCVAASCKRY